MIVLRTDWPLATLGRAAQSLWNRVTRGRRPVTGLDQRLLAERDTIRAVLGSNWRQAALLTAGRLGFDYGCLLAALRATGASPQPSLVLLAYAAAGIVALFPLTPGGLGIVEASLSGLLILAGVRAGYAVLAILAYRIASYWLPLLAGPPAYLLFRHRYGRPVPRRAAPGEAGSTAQPGLLPREPASLSPPEGSGDTPAHPPGKPSPVTGHARLRPGFASACPPGISCRARTRAARLGRQFRSPAWTLGWGRCWATGLLSRLLAQPQAPAIPGAPRAPGQRSKRKEPSCSSHSARP